MGDMEEHEDRGFVVKDRRKVSLDDTNQEAPAEHIQEEAKAVAEEKQADSSEDFRSSSERRNAPLPEVSLATFIFSLSSSALVHLGEIPDPEVKNVAVDLPLAKQIIDTLGMLQEKTKGNLDPDEDNLLKSVLYDLRLRYVQKSSK
jgi:hypothetical protein